VRAFWAVSARAGAARAIRAHRPSESQRDLYRAVFGSGCRAPESGQVGSFDRRP
jgi:hypothetical protein